MEHCHSRKIPDCFDMVVVVAAWTEEDDPGESSSGSWEESKKPWSL